MIFIVCGGGILSQFSHPSTPTGDHSSMIDAVILVCGVFCYSLVPLDQRERSAVVGSLWCDEGCSDLLSYNCNFAEGVVNIAGMLARSSRIYIGFCPNFT